MKETADIRNLYRRTVVDHSQHPRNFRRLANASATAEGHNPLCGDKITVYLRIGDDSIDEIGFEGVGCAIALASASIMTQQVAHKTTTEAQLDIEAVMAQFDRRDATAPPVEGDMAALSGVRSYPSRIKCATLAWKTLAAALTGDGRPVTTEN